MLKRAFFGGFKYSWAFWIFFIISILFVLLNLGIVVLTILIDVYSWFSLVAFSSEVNFENEVLLIIKFCIVGSINILLFVLEIVIFVKSITYTVFIFSMNSEINGISYKNGDSNSTSLENREEGFEFTSLDTKPYYFQVINIKNLPKYLFYLKSNDKRRRIFIDENQNIFQNNQSASIRNNNNFDNTRSSERLSLNIVRTHKRNSTSNKRKRKRKSMNNSSSNIGININNKAKIKSKFKKLKEENERLKKENKEMEKKIESIKGKISEMVKRINVVYDKHFS